MAEVLVRLAIAAVIAMLVAWLDNPLLGIQLAWWVCALIGLVLTFGGFLILVIADE